MMMMMPQRRLRYWLVQVYVGLYSNVDVVWDFLARNRIDDDIINLVQNKQCR